MDPQRYRYIKCVLCGSTSRLMFHFPRKNELVPGKKRFIQWMTFAVVCGANFNDLTNKKHNYLCSVHFTDNQFQTPRRLSLLRTAVPSINLKIIKRYYLNCSSKFKRAGAEANNQLQIHKNEKEDINYSFPATGPSLNNDPLIIHIKEEKGIEENFSGMEIEGNYVYIKEEPTEVKWFEAPEKIGDPLNIPIKEEKHEDDNSIAMEQKKVSDPLNIPIKEEMLEEDNSMGTGTGESCVFIKVEPELDLDSS